ncbi:MAG TPA: methyltransferase [Ktedonobacterales bacterium]|jgi:SAM-dependent methyltransferase|nr:methyltransferase [Ktedonobacterales bacterium]
MLITLTCHAPNAPDIGYLFGKNPASLFAREFSGGRVLVFYPEVADDHLTITLLTEIDPIALVRTASGAHGLDQYVNDRPYVASSLTSVALNVAFGSALGGKSRERPERVNEVMRWEISLPVVACDAGEEFITRIFAPLGYGVTVERLPLDSAFPAWGPSNLYALRLSGEQTVQAVLSHLYVLLPVLDNAKHYYIEASETEKLLRHGGAWLAAHRERRLITRRYLRYHRPLVTSALARLASLALEEGDEDAEANADTSEETLEETPEDVTSEDVTPEGVTPSETVETRPTPARKTGHLHTQRLEAVIEAVRAANATSLVDLGCGEGRLLTLALKERGLKRILGMDVSSFALSHARRYLHLDDMPPAQRERIEIVQGSLLYRDKRLEGFDVASLVEVVEHLDPPRLDAMERVIFAHARPRRVIVTTPNREYNVHWEALGAEKLRHRDHRFEWTRAEGQAWAERVSKLYGYSFVWREIGAADEGLGAPSQMMIFDRQDDAQTQHEAPATENGKEATA